MNLQTQLNLDLTQPGDQLELDLPGGEVTGDVDVETINVSAAGDVVFSTNTTIDYDWDDLAINTTGIHFPTSSAVYGGGTITIGPNSYSTPPKPKDLDVDGNINIKGDIVIDGKSLVETLESLCERLAVLVPNKDNVEDFNSLKEVYKQYKILENLVKNGK